MGKMISVAFYFGEINLASFQRKFGVTVEEVFPHEVAFVFQHGLMEYTDTALRLTTTGARQVNGVIALFYAPAVKEHLLKLSLADSGMAGQRDEALESSPIPTPALPFHLLKQETEGEVARSAGGVT